MEQEGESVKDAVSGDCADPIRARIGRCKVADDQCVIADLRRVRRPVAFSDTRQPLQRGPWPSGNAINLTASPAMAYAAHVAENGARLHSAMASNIC